MNNEYGKIDAINDIHYLRWLLMNKDFMAKTHEFSNDKLNGLVERLDSYIEQISVERKQLKKARAEARRFKGKYLKTKQMFDDYRIATTYFADSEKIMPKFSGSNCEYAEFDADGCYCKKYSHIVTCCGDISRCNKEIYEKTKDSDICHLACNICAFNTLNKR